MGIILNLACSTCGYRTGNLYNGAGMITTQEIILCNRCQRFVSIIVSINPDAPIAHRAELAQDLNRCPRCHGVELTQVDAPYACPRCGEELIETGLGGIWD